MQSVRRRRPTGVERLSHVDAAGRRRLRQLEPVLQLLSPGRQQPIPWRHIVRQHRARLGRHIPGQKTTSLFLPRHAMLARRML